MTTYSNHTIQGNFIGTQIDGVSPLGNQLEGLMIFGGQHDDAIGGTASGAANVIAFNGQGGTFFGDPGAGVKVYWISAALTERIAVVGNSIHSNAGLGIDLVGGDSLPGVTANDPGDGDTGPNRFQNYPVLTSSSSSGASTSIEGALNSVADTSFRVEFFSNTACDPSGNGEGETYLGFANVTTNGSGNASLSQAIPATVTAGHFITATATDPTNNTSEFSACIEVMPLPAVPEVSGTGLMVLASPFTASIFLAYRRHRQGAGRS